MSDMKCPFCQQRLDADDLLFSCINENCEESFDMVGTALLWQEFISAKKELDRTRKALDILLFTINRLENQNYKDCAWHLRLAIAKIEASGIANKALDKIKALEQKDK